MIKEKNQFAVELGRLSAQSRLKGKSKKERSEIMKKVRNGRNLTNVWYYVILLLHLYIYERLWYILISREQGTFWWITGIIPQAIYRESKVFRQIDSWTDYK